MTAVEAVALVVGVFPELSRHDLTIAAPYYQDERFAEEMIDRRADGIE